MKIRFINALKCNEHLMSFIPTKGGSDKVIFISRTTKFRFLKNNLRQIGSLSTNYVLLRNFFNVMNDICVVVFFRKIVDSNYDRRLQLNMELYRSEASLIWLSLSPRNYKTEWGFKWFRCSTIETIIYLISTDYVWFFRTFYSTVYL